MADVTIYFEGYNSITQTYNSGGYNQNVAFTGLASGLGSVTVVQGTGVTISVTGVAGTGAVGTVGFSFSGSVVPTGVSGTGAVGTALVRGWNTIDDSQTPNWVEIAA